MREQAAVLALVRASQGDWYQTADVIAEAGSAVRLLASEMPVMSAERRQRARELLSRVTSTDLSDVQELIERVTSQGVRLITITDEDYPENLKLIFNRPPFIWVRGQLDSRSLRAIAVVGTRQATEDGRVTAARLAGGLARAGVTVLSGLARGIDTAAHTATIEAGGRTIAVIGNGILGHVYPPENQDLARRIIYTVNSQLWHVLRYYKDGTGPSTELLAMQVAAILARFTAKHLTCVAALLDGQPDVVTSVPSTRARAAIRWRQRLPESAR